MSMTRVRWLRTLTGKRAHAFAFGRNEGEEIVSQCSRWFALQDVEIDERDAIRCGTCRFVLESWQATQTRIEA